MPVEGVDRDNKRFAEQWFGRINKGIKAKEETWEVPFEIARCKNYWKGKQLDDPFDEFEQRKVQINKVHPTVRASIPTLYFHDPFARVRASPAIADTPGPKPGLSIDDKAQLLQDTGNTLMWDPSTGFDESTHAALKEAHWAYGCCRVMYDAVPVENPNILAPPIKEDKDTETGEEQGLEMRLGNILGLNEAFTPAKSLIKSERIYVKRIPSRQVFFPADHTGIIAENSWVGYWTIHYVEDVRNSPKYTINGELKASGVKTGEDDELPGSASNKVKLYTILDLRTKTEFVFADGHEEGPIFEQKFIRFPLFILRFDVDPDSAYPIPPIYHELHPQDEFNDSREWLRKNRKGTVARYTYDKLAVDPKDMKKLESGDMGTYIPREPNTHSVIEPVQQPNYSAVAMQTLVLSKEEFIEASMVAGERKGVPQSRTATQAKIIDVRSQVQESFDRVTVAKFLGAIVEEMIRMAAERMSLTQWVLMNADPSADGFFEEANRISEMWKEISRDDLGNAMNGVRWRVVIEESSMSPVAEQQERDKWMDNVLLFKDPIITRMMALSPEFRRRTLWVNGIKSARDQELMGKMFILLVNMEMRMAELGAAPPKGTPSPTSDKPGEGHGGPPGPRGPEEPVVAPPGGTLGGARVPM